MCFERFKDVVSHRYGDLRVGRVTGTDHLEQERRGLRSIDTKNTTRLRS